MSDERQRLVAGRKDAPDTVRALAAVAVVISHAVQIIWLPLHGLGTWSHRLNSFLSDTAVIVFLVLSGFFISASIVANISSNGKFKVVDFAVSRCLRIYPPLAFAALLSVGLYLAMQVFSMPGVRGPLAFAADKYVARETVHVSLFDVVNAITMRDGLLLINGPLWSLYLEVKLYALAGILALTTFGARHKHFPVAAIAITLLVGYLALMMIPRPHWFYAAWWCVGASCCLAGIWRAMVRKISLIACAVSTITIILLTDASLALEIGRVVFVLALSYAMFFRWTSGERITGGIAEYSFTLFLVHFPILVFCYSLFVAITGPEPPSLLARVAVMVLGIVISFLCARWAAAVLENRTAIKSWVVMALAELRHRNST